MLIINADDWGRTPAETERALECFNRGRITAVSAMVFMADSKRAARVALDRGIDVGLHINFSQEFDQLGIPERLVEDQLQIVHFMRHSRFAIMFYNPMLRGSFRRTFQAQWNEFIHLYGAPPSHVDGHKHRHLCANLLVDHFIPAGVRLRRNFTYAKDERGIVNRAYRRIFDAYLSRRYRITNAFFSLGEVLKYHRFARVIQDARQGTVELMVHPTIQSERTFLLSDEFAALTRDVDFRSFMES